jgi:hypothetical protein
VIRNPLGSVVHAQFLGVLLPTQVMVCKRGWCQLRIAELICAISVQRVRCIGKPPEDKLCLFSHLVNVVVLPSVGMEC